MRLFSRKKKSETDSALPCAPPPVTLIAKEKRYARELFIALPEGSQAVTENAAETAPAFDHLLLTEPGSPSTGKYVLVAEENCRASESAVAFYSLLKDREEDVVLFPIRRSAHFRESPLLLNHVFDENISPFSFGCAVNISLYNKILKFSGDTVQPFSFAAASLGESCFFTEQAPFFRNAPARSADMQELTSLLGFFTECKASLNTERYRWAFDFICGRAIGAYAFLARQKDRAALRELDEFLRTENMAVRVAAMRRAPFRFIETLQKNNFENSLSALPGILCALQKDKNL